MNIFRINRSSTHFLASLLAAAAIALTASGCGSDKTNAHEESQANPDEAHGAKGHEEGEASRVVLTPDQIAKSGIEIGEAGPVTLREHLALYGVVAPNAERVLEVSARFPGVIHSVRKRVGDPVKRGEALATVESNESMQTYAVVSPLDGVVTQRNANEGAHAGEAPLFTVADLSTVWVEVSVFPRDVAKVHAGQLVRVRHVDTALEAEGKVVYVSPFGSSANQTLTARVQLSNKDKKWAPGLYVTAEILLGTTALPLGVMSESLQTLEERTVVFVHQGDGFEPRPVEVGRNDGDVTEILSGISAGERYATKNSFILKAELGKGEAGHED